MLCAICMKSLTMILTLMIVAGVSFGQTPDSSRQITIENITSDNTLFIQYNYGGCFLSHKFQITVVSSHFDSLTVTIKKYLPVAYRHYKYNMKKKRYEPQDSLQIENPFTFKYPPMGERDYFTVKEEYLQQTSFSVLRSRFTAFLNEFLYQADNHKLPISGENIEGLYCNIQLNQSHSKKEYTFDGWYQLDYKLQLLQ
jgi:hypothetical protein